MSDRSLLGYAQTSPIFSTCSIYGHPVQAGHRAFGFLAAKVNRCHEKHLQAGKFVRGSVSSSDVGQRDGSRISLRGRH